MSLAGHDPLAQNETPPDIQPIITEPPTIEPNGPPTTANTKRPVVSRLRLVPSRFRVHGRHRGTTISFSLSRSARVTLRFQALRTRHHHAIARSVGSLARSSRTGSNRIRFTGTLRGRALKRGRYRLTATPLGGRTVTARFTVR